MPLWNESTSILLLDAFFKPKHVYAGKPEVPKSWTLEMDYSRAPCLGADQKTCGLWERDCDYSYYLRVFTLFETVNFAIRDYLLFGFSRHPQMLRLVWLSDFVCCALAINMNCHMFAWTGFFVHHLSSCFQGLK